MKTSLDHWAEEYANDVCPGQDSSDIPWCMCNQDFRAGFEACKEEAKKNHSIIRHWVDGEVFITRAIFLNKLEKLGSEEHIEIESE